jgi:hypothetical protein
MERGVKTDDQDNKQVSKVVTRYMARNRLTIRGCSFGSSVSPKRRNSDTNVRFLDSMLMVILMEKMEREQQNVWTAVTIAGEKVWKIQVLCPHPTLNADVF